MHRFLTSLLLLSLLVFRPQGENGLQAQDSIRVMYYNLLNFPSAGAANRQDSMAPIVAHIQPDLILVCELESAGGGNDFLGMLNGLGLGPWASAAFVSNQSGVNNLQNLAYYRSDRLSLEGQDVILTDLRDINEYRFQSTGGTRFDAYVAHLKAGTGSTNEGRRESAINAFKSHLAINPGAPFKLFGGDLNLYTSSEDAYQALLNDAPIQFGDPINRPGSWSNSFSYADIHTQSTRSTSFGTGASGGLDDRFDHIVLSQSILADTGAVRYLSGSYDAVGNDGSHFNQAINNGFNAAVPASVADALHQSSDHLPVVLDLILDAGSDTSTGPPTSGGCSGLFFSEYIEGSSNNKALELYNPGSDPVSLAGYEISVFNNGNSSATNTEILSGTVPGMGTYRIVNSSADAALLGLADMTSSVTFYNGDDALVLYKDGVAVDAIGVVGVDPGSSWPVGSGSTSEYTLVRKAAVTEGQTDWAIGATQWDVYPQNTFSFYGAHTGEPCATPDSCSASTPPANPVSTIGPSGVEVAWDPLPGALKCEVNGRPLGNPGFAKVRGDVPPHLFFVPSGALNPGTTYEWKVRCACTLSPLVATPFSTLDTFTWPLLRGEQEDPVQRAEEVLVDIFPNPASEQVILTRSLADVSPSVLEGTRTWTVYNAFGQTVASGRWPSNAAPLHIDCSTWPVGHYRIYSPANAAGKILFGSFAIVR